MIVLYEKGKREDIELVRFSPDGQSLLAASFSTVRLWSGLPNPEPPKVLPDLRHSLDAQFTLDGKKLLTDQHTLAITDLTNGTSRRLELWNDWRALFNMTPDGRHVLVAQNNRGVPNGWIACCPVDDPTPKAAVWSRELPRALRNPPVCVSEDRFLLTESWWEPSLVSNVYSYVICSLKTGQPITAIEGPHIGWSPFVTSADGQLLATMLNSRIVVLSVTDLSKPVATVHNDSRKYFTGIAFHPSGKYLAATSNDQTVKFYDTITWEVAKTFTWKISKTRSIAFSPDGTLAAAGGYTGKVIVWDVDV